MSLEKPEENALPVFSLPEMLVGAAVVLVIGVLSFSVVAAIKRSVAQSLESDVIEVSLPPRDELPGKIPPLESIDDPGGILEIVGKSIPPRREDDEFVSEVPIEALAIPKFVKTAKPLAKPKLSVETGEYPPHRFPMELRVSNPNDPSTWTMISVNGGPFTKFDAGALQIRPGDRISAYVRGDTREWIESEIVTGHYTLPPGGAKPYRAPVRRIKFGPR